jgi:serine/threonine protein kinase
MQPENVLLTHGGHIKLTDFGGCVPLSDSSRRTMENARHFLRHLKDADWRAIQAGHQGSDNVDWISHGSILSH